MAFKDDSRLDSSRIERTGSTRSGKGAALGGGLGGAALLLLVAVFFGQDGVNLLNQVAGADYSFSNIEQENAGETLTECKTGTDANSNSDCNMVGTANSLDNFWSSFLPTAAGVDYQPPKLRLFFWEHRFCLWPCQQRRWPLLLSSRSEGVRRYQLFSSDADPTRC